MSIVHVVRHGQVDNPTGILYERLPGYHLSDLGQLMARQTAEFFSDLPITHLRCSPLERAQETMAPIHALFPSLPVVTDDRLTEAGNVFVGQVMGTTAHAARSAKNWRYLVNPLRPSWGEPYAAIADRMLAGIQAAAVAAGEDQAVIVSHQLPIWMARLRVEGRRLWHDPRKRQCSLASVTSFHFSAGLIRSISYLEPAANLLPNRVAYGF